MNVSGGKPDRKGETEMNWTIKRNWEERKALQAEMVEREKKREEALNAIPDDLEDEEYYELSEKIFKEYSNVELAKKIVALEYKESRNEWFKQFVQPFGICEERRITRKQGDVFVKYSEPNHERESGRGINYFVWVGDLFIKTTVFSQHEPCYVTINKF